MNIKEIKDKYTCVDFLGEPVKRTSSGYLYHSPYREDRHPSLSVTADGRGWHDLATGEHGSVIDLVMRCLNTTDVKCAIEAIEAKTPFSFSQQNALMADADKRKKESGFKSLQIVPLHSRSLLDYLEKRGIDPGIARKFLKEAHYSFNEGAGKGKYYALAYPNDKGGVELRNLRFKGSKAPKGITTHFTQENAPEGAEKGSCVVFEGVFDMLSFATLTNGVKHDYVTLNSVVNADAAIDVLKNYDGNIYLALDNDQAGRAATAKILAALPYAQDIAERYAPHKDINDYLLDKNSVNMNQEQEIKDKWGEVLDYARQYATGEGMHHGFAWLRDSFSEYVAMAEKTPGYSPGGTDGSTHNREVLAEKILQSLGHHIGGDGVISEAQETHLRDALTDIAASGRLSLKV